MSAIMSRVSINQEQRLVLEEWARAAGVPVGHFRLPGTFVLDGPLDEEALAVALRAIVAKHDSLRLRFHATGDRRWRDQQLETYGLTRGIFDQGMYRCSIAPASTMSVVMESAASATSTADIAAWAMRHQTASREANAAPPHVEAAILRLSRDRHILQLTCEHLVVDAISMMSIVRDLQRAYAQVRSIGTAELPSDAPGYIAFAERQVETLSMKTADLWSSYWLERWRRWRTWQLRYSDLPFAAAPQQPRCAHATVAVTTLPIDASTSDDIRNVIRHMRVTPFVVFLAATALAMRECTRRAQLILWVGFANRMPTTVSTVGWFANSHALGVDMSTDVSGRQLVEQVRRTVTDSSRWQHVPLAQVWRVLGRTYDTADLRIGFDYFRERPRILAGSTVMSPYPLPERVEGPHLHFLAIDRGATLELRALYAGERFAAPDIRRLLDRLYAYILGLVDLPDAPLSCYQ